MHVVVTIVVAMLLALAAQPSKIAQAIEPPASQPITDCRSAAAAFEQSAGLPAGLLLAIGQVESGRADPVTGRVDPWPWTTNLAGEGHYFNSAQEAIDWVAAQQAYGSRSIDVGCFQVNLYYHPNAFASLEQAFDPAANAQYAAAFLNHLHDQSGNWASAIALYHSADPFEGSRYSNRVMEAWNNGGRIAAAAPMLAYQPSDSVVVKLAAAASAVHVVVPSWAANGASAAADRRAGLPRVLVPGR